MHLQYFGLSSFKLTTKDAVVVTDPFGKDSGLTPPRGAADILVLAEKNNSLYNATSGFSGEPFVVSDPGEYDTKGVTISGIPLQIDRGWITVTLLESEDIKVLNLAHISEFSIKDDDLENLGEIDIVLVPVGGNGVMDAATAAKIVNQIEPKIVIPSHYQIPGLKTAADTVDRFVKEMGGKNESMEKLIIKKKDLTQKEGISLIVLEALR